MLKLNTREILFHSFTDLLEKKDYSRITVTDIVNGCGASRSVFYKYFPDKYSLAVWPSEQYMNQVHADVLSGKIPTEEEATRLRMQHYYDHQTYYQKIVSYHGQNSLEESIRTCLPHNWAETLAHKMNVSSLSTDLQKAIVYHSRAQAAMITEWIQKGFPSTPEEFSLEMLSDAYNIRENNLLYHIHG